MPEVIDQRAPFLRINIFSVNNHFFVGMDPYRLHLKDGEGWGMFWNPNIFDYCLNL
ncbi:hypothetical protein D3C80_1914810 [compost metagenome]